MTEKGAALLNARARDVLEDVVYTYIMKAEPVSSRAVAKQFDFSAATVRSVLADLDDLGYLRQPHTSAGRVPTAEGYHAFIDFLMKDRELPRYEQLYIERHLEGVGDIKGLTVAATHLLSECSHQAAVMLVPLRGDIVLRTVDFVPLPGSKVLCVIVSSTGFIDNRVIEVDEALPREELVRISNYLTENFDGLTLSEARKRLIAMMDDDKAEVDELMRRSIHLAQRGLEAGHEPPDVLVEGAEVLLEQPELADVERIRRIFEAFADKAQLVTMLTKCVESDGVRVFIGEDAALTSELDFSLVATNYGIGDQTLGSLGVLGPSRMEYPRLIPLVHFLGRAVSAALANGVASE
jgi:heat-inducible transcriptional repressor